MNGFNRVILAGNLTRDPQLSYTPTNTPVCQFGLALNRKWRDRDGNMKEEVCFVDVSAFGRSAETINQYMAKGRAILVEGRLKFRQWTDKEGKNRSKLDVVAENFTFLGGPGAPGQGGGERGGYAPRPAARPAAAPTYAPAAAPDDQAVDEPPPIEDAPPPSETEIPF